MLDATQRRLWRLLTAPEGVAAALREAGDPDGRSLAGWLVSDARADAAAHLHHLPPPASKVRRAFTPVRATATPSTVRGLYRQRRTAASTAWSKT